MPSVLLPGRWHPLEYNLLLFCPYCWKNALSEQTGMFIWSSSMITVDVYVIFSIVNPLLNNYGVMLQHDQATKPTRPSNIRVKMNTYTILRFKDKHILEHCNRVLRSVVIRYYVPLNTRNKGRGISPTTGKALALKLSSHSPQIQNKTCFSTRSFD